jgi:hypothetical protein
VLDRIRRLTLKWNCQGGVDLQVLLHYVKDGAIIDLVDSHEVAHLVLVLYLPDAFTCYHHTSDTVFFILWPSLPKFLAGVEESCHGGAAWLRCRQSGRGQSEALPNPPYGTYVFLP